MNINTHIKSMNDAALAKRLFKIILFFVYPAYIVHSCITSQLFTDFNNNVQLRDFSIIFDILNDLIDLSVFFLSYAVIIYGIYRLSFKQIRSTFYLAMLSPVFKYTLKLIISFVGYNRIVLNDFWMAIYSFGISGTLEIAQFLLVIFISKGYIEKYKQMEKVYSKASKLAGSEGADEISAVPFKRLVSLKNPLQRGAFVSAVVVSALRLVMLAINDITKGIYAVDLGGYLIIVGGYILEIIIGVIGYMFMLYLFITLTMKENKTN